MTVLRYMARQRERIILRHVGEAYLYESGDAVMVNGRTADDVLGEINAMKGLNLAERQLQRVAAPISFNCI